MIDEAVRREVERRLDTVERDEGALILFACESGSRAWGFASSDSDYDVRFIYIKRPEWYLSVDQRRDVIEREIVDEIDLNGWDLLKSLQLLRKSNPTLFEWLGSPIVYRERTPTAAALKVLAIENYSPLACAYHYLHMAKNNSKALRGSAIRRKKYLYVVRPLLAVQWLERGKGIVPTEFSTLVRELVREPELGEALDELVARKMAGREVDEGPKIEPISRFVDAELARHEPGLSIESRPAAEAEDLDALFHRALDEAWDHPRPSSDATA